jgi:FixJ family two-component response regulator
VLNKLLEGGTSKHIARDLGISPRTVEAHRQHVLHKLEVGSVRELMLHQLARDRGK